MNKLERFIERANAIHNNKYDYSKVDYKDCNTKVCIICPEHGEFWQTPKQHLKGHGCKKCASALSSNKRSSTKENFIERAKLVHGDKYDYSKVEYVNNSTPVCIICPTHGEFYQSPKSHLNGSGCPKCFDERRQHIRKYDNKLFIEKAKLVHGDKYDYSKVDYKDSNTKVCIICPEHGEFWQTPAHHLSGEGCPKCALSIKSEEQQMTKASFVEAANKIHNNKYSYYKFVYNGGKEKSIIICPVHGEFEMTPNAHLRGQGCPICGIEATADKLRGNKEDFIKKAQKIHGDKYDYSKVNYVNYKTKVEIICKKHGSFLMTPCNHIQNQAGCPKCAHQQSKSEKEIYEYIKSLNVFCEEGDRGILKGKEIDVFAPIFRVGIEFDGLRWHSELYRDKNYHLNKTVECEDKGIRLIHIFEDEWLNKRDIWESMLRNVFHKITNKIYARKCTVKFVSERDKKIFLNGNHIQGNANSSVNLGLYYNDELVSLMTFGKPRINMGGKDKDGYWELVRFCNKLNTSVVGGASKLFKHFIKDYNPINIVSYSDKRWATGGLYDKLGFIHDHDSKPNYYYVINNERKNRFGFRKDKLIKEGFDKNKSEHEIMLERKIYRIYDCGCRCHIWKKAKENE